MTFDDMFDFFRLLLEWLLYMLFGDDDDFTPPMSPVYNGNQALNPA